MFVGFTTRRGLSCQDVALLLQAVGLLVETEWRLKIGRLLGRSPDIRVFLEPDRTVPVPDRGRTTDSGRVILAVNRVSRTLRLGTCLSRALVSARLLRRGGLDAVVRLGVRKTRDRLAAHAWIEGPSVAFGNGNKPGRHVPLVFRKREGHR